MTNEEKAREICGGNFIAFNKEFSAALQMAEWKDHQFKECLEKKKVNYIHRRELWHQDTLEFCCYDSQIDTIEEIINELFEKD